MGKQEVRATPCVSDYWYHVATRNSISNHKLRDRACYLKPEVPWIFFQAYHKPPKRGKERESPWVTDIGLSVNLDRWFSELVINQFLNLGAIEIWGWIINLFLWALFSPL